MHSARVLLIPFLLLGGVGGCASSPAPRPVQPIDGQVSGHCHLDSVRGARGLAASAQTLERARVDSDSLQLRTVRVAHDMPAASLPADAQQGGERLTVSVGRNNAITDLRCE